MEKIMMKNLQRVLLSMVLLLLLLNSPCFGQQSFGDIKTVKISVIENEHIHNMARKTVRAVYEKIGIEVIFCELPARRALEWANAGKTDGDLARIDGTEKKFTNLIKILTPVTTFKGVVFTKKIKKGIQSWNDLKGLSVGIIAGIRYSDIGTKGLDRIQAKDMTHLMTLLFLDRLEVAIADLDSGQIEIKKNFPESKIHTIGRPLDSAPLFHFIHKKNKGLVPRFESALRDMLKSGQIDLIRKKVLQEVLF
ncbi:conserved uncharacterized protein [Desulfobacula toluolica Tol2]|uniref:Conserved uncharacterized protein n=2 Tax=Desulfobacula toluolica TaxID=28223 RepID=K0NCJ9_DESTT|nr:conserved uncharacterized protein [Desulfobacula toluolica Tol2]